MRSVLLVPVVDLLFILTLSNYCSFGTGFLPGDQKWIRRSVSAQRPSLVHVANADGNNKESTEPPADEESSCRSSDMTDRFKYKVNALMGTYDPLIGDDNERQDGNILQAMLEFPVRYTFNIVGKTNGYASSETYVDQVKKVILQTCGDQDATWEIQKRGEKFTKIKCEVEVQSSTMVNQIYTDISSVNGTVMRF